MNHDAKVFMALAITGKLPLKVWQKMRPNFRKQLIKMRPELAKKYHPKTPNRPPYGLPPFIPF